MSTLHPPSPRQSVSSPLSGGGSTAAARPRFSPRPPCVKLGCSAAPAAGTRRGMLAFQVWEGARDALRLPPPKASPKSVEGAEDAAADGAQGQGRAEHSRELWGRKKYSAAPQQWEERRAFAVRMRASWSGKSMNTFVWAAPTATQRGSHVLSSRDAPTSTAWLDAPWASSKGCVPSLSPTLPPLPAVPAPCTCRRKVPMNLGSPGGRRSTWKQRRRSHRDGRGDVCDG